MWAIPPKETATRNVSNFRQSRPSRHQSTMNLTRYIYYISVRILHLHFCSLLYRYILKKKQKEKLHFLSLPFSRIRAELRVDDENVLVATPITIFCGDFCVHENWSQYICRKITPYRSSNEFKIVEHILLYLIETQKKDKKKQKKMLVTITNAGCIRTKRGIRNALVLPIFGVHFAFCPSPSEVNHQY